MPAVVHSDELRAEVDGSGDGRVGIVELDVRVDPCRPVDLLEVEVRRTQRWLEAPQLRVA